MTSPTKMSERRQAVEPQVAPRASKMSAVRATVARGELVTLPIYGEVWIELLGLAQMESIESAVFKHMAEVGLPAISLNSGSYNLQRFARVLALAVRDPDDPSHQARFGTLQEWQDEHEDVVTGCIAKYMEVKGRLDPSSSPFISDEDSEAVLEAFKKKDWTQMRSFARDTLASFLLSGAVRPTS